ncbi:hypothetical protein ANTHELSMS3_01816 [Antarctobacter heliothermus]|uniref:Uncharacterized protein n=1 Tax=Antarctobacter heliothermus TaxID=74033 RepID=A0A222E2R2_9RHOB|nr:DUF6220 domain-containing protein [Antarctobacter heliothermus]ASP20504.1 hypothetical protein ANTHELSMS3_01816 [Antarctobacter heliothermus]
MTADTHDTFVALDRGTPALFVWSARLFPVALAGQFVLDGQSLFAGLPWSIHGMAGGLAAVPIIIIMAAMAFATSYLRGFAWWAFGSLALYGVQIALATGSATLLALHPFNASLLLMAALVLLAKTERRRALHT